MSTERSPQSAPGEETLPKFEKIRGRGGKWYLACGEVLTFLFEYLEDEVPQERRKEFDDHLVICPSCQSYLANYRDTLLLVRHQEASDEVEIPELPQHLVDAIVRAQG